MVGVWIFSGTTQCNLEGCTLLGLTVNATEQIDKMFEFEIADVSCFEVRDT